MVESSFAGVPNALAQVPQGRLRALAVTTAKRIPQLPDVPTMQEAGVAGYEASVWLAQELVRWGKVVKDTGVKLE